MLLGELTIENWRNFTSKHFRFDDGNHVLIYGDNGSGKTSILTALYFWHHLRLPGSVHWRESIRSAEGCANICVASERAPAMRVHLDASRGVVRLFIGPKSVSRKIWNDHVHQIPIYIDSMSLNMVYLMPSLRREFLDDILAYSDISYAKSKSDYLHILSQRNRLLRGIRDGRSSPDELTYWDEQLIRFATTIYAFRKQLMDHLTGSSKWLDFFDGKYQLNFEYRSKLNPHESISDQMQSYFRVHQKKEILLARTLRGPHLDDWGVTVHVGDVLYESSQYLSRGENKYLLFVLTHLCADFVRERTGKPILFLFDDIFAELDASWSARICDVYAGDTVISTNQTPFAHLGQIIELRDEDSDKGDGGIGDTDEGSA